MLFSKSNLAAFVAVAAALAVASTEALPTNAATARVDGFRLLIEESPELLVKAWARYKELESGS
jgi:hypothetical protein